MTTWGEQLRELAELEKTISRLPGNSGASAADLLRRKYLGELAAYTGRAAIVYATPWLEEASAANRSGSLSVTRGDVQGFMEACSNITERDLDLIVTSPGGSPEAAESIMAYLRTRFDHIRFVVPVSAMSAATMMALACDEILMGDHSQLGPIDPQITVTTPEGLRSAPAQAILDQFEMAKTECQDPANIGAWLPMLRALLPGLIATCHTSRAYAEEFAEKSLASHMMKNDPDGPANAKKAAAWFADFTEFKSHGRRVGRAEALAQKLKVQRLEDDDRLQDLVLSVHHAVRHTWGKTPATKIIENHHGRCYIEIEHSILLQGPFPMPAGQIGPAPVGNRQQRRKK